MSEPGDAKPETDNASLLRETAEFLRAVVETAVDAIITIDEQGIVRTVNPATERMFGYTREEMLGKNVSMLMPQPYQREHDGYLKRYRQTGTRHIIGIGRDVEGRRKDGSRLPLHLSVSEMQVNGKRLFAGILRDVSELKREEEETRRAREAAEAASRAKDQFLAVLSHELRTPLTPALATLALLETRDDLPPEVAELLELARRNVEMQSGLIDDLLDLTRVSTGKLQLKIETLDVHPVLDDVVDICQHEIDAKSIQIDKRLDAVDHFVQGDPVRLRQVFWNLVKNAVKFTPSGGNIIIRTWNQPADVLAQPGPERPDRGRTLMVQVQDTGIGIKPEVLPSIFNAFEQGGDQITRQFGGLGLGLAISHALAVMHDATLTADSEGAGRGATFTLELRTVAPEVAKERLPHRHAALALAEHPMRILVVDDHADTARVLNLLLSRMGHHVTTAGSVSAATAAMSAGRFDLLISDIGLPDGSGLDVMREAKQRGLAYGIALSGYGMEQDIQRSREAGFINHLTKPIDLSDLRRAISQVAQAQGRQ